MADIDDGKQKDLYTGGVGWINEYTLDPGVCILPLAEDPPTDPTELAAWSPVVVLRLHAPYRIRKANYVAAKSNNPPPIPGMNDTGAFVLVSGETAIKQSLNTTSRSFDWTVACTLTYVEDCVARNRDGYVLGSPPFRWVTTVENANQYGYSPPSDGIGAIAHAGAGATTGWNQGNSIGGITPTGNALGSISVALSNVWGYNTAEFFPGTLISEDMANAGTPVVPVQG